MNIGLIIDSISSKPTGIGNYTKDTVNTLLQINDKSHQFYFIDYKENIYKKNNIVIQNFFPYFKTYLWHNYLPLKMRNSVVDIVFNFSAVPHLIPFRQREVFFVYDISWYLYPEYHPKSRVMFYRYTFQRCLTYSDKIIVDSNSTKEDLINIFSIPPGKIFVVYPTYIDITKSISTIQSIPNQPYILYIGTLEPRKNIESIIRAYAKLKKSKKIVQKLVLCGKKGWLYETIFQIIQELYLENDVFYLGYITDEEKKYLYQHADFFVFPSFYEGFGIPVLEAMSYGCPVITSNVSSLPEITGDAGLLVDPHDLNQLTDAMTQLIDKSSLRKQLTIKGYSQVKKLSNYRQIQDFLEALSL